MISNKKDAPRVVIIGMGPAGMIAAVRAAERGARVTVIDKNDKAGKKLFLTGKGRCNLTNACETSEFFDHVVRGNRFLYSAVYGFDAGEVQRFFIDRGCPLKTERGGRVFPVSDHSSDIIRSLRDAMDAAGVATRLQCQAASLVIGEDTAPPRVRGVRLADGEELPCDACIIATGGLSYPQTGSTGDGFLFARQAGHTVTETFPSLVPLVTRETWHTMLQGLSLKNVRLYTEKKTKPRYDAQGEMLFTHFGVSGPLVLTASTLYRPGATWHLFLDLKPGMTPEEIDGRLLKEWQARPRKQFANSVSGWFPAKLAPVMVALSGIAQDKEAGQVTAAERRAFGALIKRLPVTVTGTRGYEEAVVTRGGVTLREVDPSTMASKLCDGLYFAGEVLDCDAVTGGFNLQIAWSTGYRAGESAADDRREEDGKEKDPWTDS